MIFYTRVEHRPIKTPHTKHHTEGPLVYRSTLFLNSRKSDGERRLGQTAKRKGLQSVKVIPIRAPQTVQSCQRHHNFSSSFYFLQHGQEISLSVSGRWEGVKSLRCSLLPVSRSEVFNRMWRTRLAKRWKLIISQSIDLVLVVLFAATYVCWVLRHTHWLRTAEVKAATSTLK